MTTADFRKYLAIGTGVGIEIDAEDLHVTMVRLRPSGARILGATTIAQFRSRPAGEWGAEYAAFAKKSGGKDLSATVLMPRRETIVRQLILPGVSNRDLAAAISFQADSLHPYADDEALYDYSRIGNSPAVLIGIARRTVVEEYVKLFVEAGIKVASFTFSAAVLYSAIRLFRAPSAGGFVGIARRSGELEVYGESPSRGIFSAAFSASLENPAAPAAAELRLPPETEPLEIEKLLPAPRKVPPGYDLACETLPYATALAGACPRPALKANLLPPELRSGSSRLVYAPTAVLAALLLLCLAALGMQAPLDDRSYLAALESETARLQPAAMQADRLDQAIAGARNRSLVLDEFRMRSKSDLDALNELTTMIPTTAYVNSLELTRTSLTIAGEAEQAAGMLKLIDGAAAFQNSEFTIPLGRTVSGEIFRIRAARKGAK
jgi:hypothetical protein